MSLVKRVIRRLLSFCPYTISRRLPSAELPSPTMDNIGLVLPYFCGRPEGSTFVQIGACDGVSGDSCHAFVRQGKLRAVLVEPVDASFQKLQQLYKEVPTVTLVRAAIGHSDGNVKFYKVKESGVQIDEFWARQLASFDRRHLLKHGVASENIEEVEVPCVSLESLVRVHKISRIDLLQIDTEGFDGEIVKMALTLPEQPLCINFEHTHLDLRTRDEVFTALKRNAYSWTHDNWNTLAMHRDWIGLSRDRTVAVGGRH